MTSLKTPKMKREEQRLGKPLEVIIPEAYKKTGSVALAAKELGISQDTLYRWMIRLRLTTERRITTFEQDSNSAPPANN